MFSVDYNFWVVDYVPKPTNVLFWRLYNLKNKIEENTVVEEDVIGFKEFICELYDKIFSNDKYACADEYEVPMTFREIIDKISYVNYIVFLLEKNHK